ncbi:FYVE zinc finger-domain-containing protein [Gongronella butleri]|nr:FYVE zinc finger-domain-containing protein [Gongronella butleri]
MSYNYEDFVPMDAIVCPICQVSCASLQKLNLHLDAAHSEEDTKGALLSWFKQAQRKVQTTLSNKGGSPMGSAPGSSTSPVSFKPFADNSFLAHFQQLAQAEPNFFVCETERHQDTISRHHWQMESGQDACSYRGCAKMLGRASNGKQHCRRCGKLFCDEHTQYEVKLSHDAQYDPAHGTWSKVCTDCFHARPGYTDHEGTMRSHSAHFLQRRTKTIDQVYLESNRLEKRLEKLARLHFSTDMGPRALSGDRQHSFSPLDRGSPSSSNMSISSGTLSPRSSFGSNTNSILSMKLKYRDGEQTITKWQDDKGIKKCPLCSSTFSMTNRKHHCRLCGRVVCGASYCSSMIPLYLNMTAGEYDEEPVGDTRACQECKRAAFRRKHLVQDSGRVLPIFQLYQRLSSTRLTIEKLLPNFHTMMLTLEQDKVMPGQEAYKKAAMVRKSLLDSFALYDTLVKSIKSLPAQSACMKRLQANICTAASIYLQRNMLPLQMLPRILKPNKSNKRASTASASNGAKDDDLRIQLQAFREQYAQIQSFIQDAKQNRKYDDVKSLTISLQELHDEIIHLERQFSL